MPTKHQPTLEEWGEEQEQAKFAETAVLARQLRAARASALAATEQLEGLRRRLDLYESLEAERIKPPKWLTPHTSAKTNTAIPALLLTDLHWDEVINPAEVDGINAYNRTIAEMRIRRTFERTVRVTRDYLSNLKYEGFQLFLGGDLMSGIIHDELRETNQDTVMDSILSLLDPLTAGINLLAESFDKVNITAVVGNHGRNTKKPRSKLRAKDNFDWLIYKLIEREYHGTKNVTMQAGEAADAYVSLYNTRYLLTHGDQFRGGSGIAGAMSPLLLGAHRKTRRQAAAGKPYDVMVMGHFHQSLFYPSKGLIVGGSIVGYSEYGYTGNLEPEPPQQALWLTTPQHGVTFHAPIFVQDREAEGW